MWTQRRSGRVAKEKNSSENIKLWMKTAKVADQDPLFYPLLEINHLISYDGTALPHSPMCPGVVWHIATTVAPSWTERRARIPPRLMGQ